MSTPKDSSVWPRKAIYARANTQMNSNYETKERLAERYDVGVRTVNNWMRTGKIPFLKLSERLVRFDPAAVDRALGKFTVDGRSKDAA